MHKILAEIFLEILYLLFKPRNLNKVRPFLRFSVIARNNEFIPKSKVVSYKRILKKFLQTRERHGGVCWDKNNIEKNQYRLFIEGCYGRHVNIHDTTGMVL